MPINASRPGSAAAGSHSVRPRFRPSADEFDRVQAALLYIDPRPDDIWRRVGMGLKDEFGEDGWPIFDGWSRRTDNYDERQNRARWRSFKSGAGITIATVFGMARDGGWRDDASGLASTTARATPAHPACQFSSAERANADPAVMEAVRIAGALWAAGKAMDASTPYSARKGIPPTDALRQIGAAEAEAIIGRRPSGSAGPLDGTCVLVPIHQGDRLASVQLIDGGGRKHFLKGGAVAGGWWAARPLPEGDGAGLKLLIGEGVATVASAIEATDAIGLAALMNSNIPAVAITMRERYPRAEIVVLADLDKKTGEPDSYAVRAAECLGGTLAVPRFGEGPAPDRKDFNDMARVHGLDAVQTAINAAELLARVESPGSKTSSKPKTTVTLTQASTIPPEAVSWLWEGYLARGKVHILGGKPAAGKTTLAIAMAATVTTGGTWPDGTCCEPGNVVIWSGEDDPADTLVPRLIAADANLDRVHFVSGTIEDSESIPFDPARHLPALSNAMAGLENVRLLIVDPVVSAVAGDSYKNAEVRRALQPLADLGASAHCVVLGITHFTKGTGGRDPVERITGSLAFGALARVVLVAAKSEEDAPDADVASAGRRLMMRAKSNIGPEGNGFEYGLAQRELADFPGIITSAVQWGAAVNGTARELLAEVEATDGADGDSVSEAAEWLQDLLAAGPIPAPKIKAAAPDAGHSWATVRRAQKRLGVKPRKQGMTGGWAWELP